MLIPSAEALLAGALDVSDNSTSASEVGATLSVTLGVFSFFNQPLASTLPAVFTGNAYRQFGYRKRKIHWSRPNSKKYSAL